MGKRCQTLVAVAVLGMRALWAEGTLPTETVWPCGDVKVVAGPCTRVDVDSGIARVRAVDAPANVWPAAYFTFPSVRDLSRAGAVNVTVTNFTDRVLRISVKVKGETVQGRLPDSCFDLPPSAVHTKVLPLFAESWAFDKPHGLVGLKRNPGVGGMSSYALDKVASICVYLPAGTREGEFGVEKIEMTPGGAQGNRLTVLKADSFCPWVDEFGQANFAEWPDKVHSRAELRTRADSESRELAAKPVGIPDADRFGGWAAGPQLKATGFFRTEKVNGKWWLVDPDGHLFLSHGVCCGWDLDPTGISGRESYFEKLPSKEGATGEFWQHFKRPAFRNYYSRPENAPFWGFSFSAYDLFLKFGTDWKTRYDENTVRRMRSWGINTTSCSEGSLLKTPGHAPYVLGIWPTSRFIEGAKGYWRNLYDPFAPEFAASCRKCAEAKRSLATNEWCVGWTSNNELSWGSDGIALARGVLSSKPDQPARIALEKMLAAWGTTPERATDAQLRRLGEAVAEKYYSTVRAAVKAVAPNHLYLGDRNAQRNPEVFRAASRHLDVVTVNIYEHHPSVTLPADAEDKPLLVTEFHFGCYDTGYFYASLIPVRDQKERAECYRGYWRTIVDRPDYVGAHWFCWRDCPITGQLMEGANAQCGLVSTADVPYSEMVRVLRDVSAEMYARRYGASADRKKAAWAADWRPSVRWRGFNVLSMFIKGNRPDAPEGAIPPGFGYRNPQEFREDDFQMMQDWGMNFARIPLDYRYWIKDGNPEEFDETAMGYIDRLVSLGKRHGIHVMLNFHRAPGYMVGRPARETGDVWNDPKMQDLCAKHWAFFARRYRNVPNEELSFNLFNEPPDMDDAKYGKVAKIMIDAIRREDPKRFIVSDGLAYGRRPCKALFGVPGVGQATRGYSPHSLVHGGGTVWPIPPTAPSGVFASAWKKEWHAPFSIADLPACEIELSFGRVSGRGTMVARADGEKVAEFTIDPVGKDRDPLWKKVRLEKQWNVWQGTYLGTERISLPKAAKTFTLELEKGDWIAVENMHFVSRDGTRQTDLPFAVKCGKATNFSQRFAGWKGTASFVCDESDGEAWRYPGEPGKEYLYRNVLRPWDEAIAAGVFVMVGEFGIRPSAPHAAMLAWLRDNLELWEERGWGWAVWGLHRDRFGCLDNGRTDVPLEDSRGHRLDRQMLDILRAN